MTPELEDRIVDDIRQCFATLRNPALPAGTDPVRFAAGVAVRGVVRHIAAMIAAAAAVSREAEPYAPLAQGSATTDEEVRSLLRDVAEYGHVIQLDPDSRGVEAAVTRKKNSAAWARRAGRK